MTKKEKKHLELVAGMGCVICQGPAEIHHIRAGMGMGQRNSHFHVLPLCPRHHRTGGHGIAIHAGQKTWESKYGLELDLLDIVNEQLRAVQARM